MKNFDEASTSDKPADFAMVRAVEVLAQMFEAQYSKPLTPPAPIDRPVKLYNERITLALGQSRKDIYRALGEGFTYPIDGWASYAFVAENKTKPLLSLFFRDERVIALEHYVAQNRTAPALAARSFGSFRFEPGSVAIGSAFSLMSKSFVPAVGGPGRLIYREAFEARFAGGVAYVMGNGGIVERMALYVDEARHAPKLVPGATPPTA